MRTQHIQQIMRTTQTKDIIALVTLIWYRCRSQYHTKVLSSVGTMSTFTFFLYEPFSNLKKRSLLKEFLTPVHIYVLFISYIITLNKGTYFSSTTHISIKWFFSWLSFLTLSSSYPIWTTIKQQIKNNFFCLLTMQPMQQNAL